MFKAVLPYPTGLSTINQITFSSQGGEVILPIYL